MKVNLTDPIFERYASINPNLNQLTLIETQPAEQKPDGIQPEAKVNSSMTGFYETAFWIPLSFLMVLAIATFGFSAIQKAIRKRMVSITYSQQVPCRNCRFFTNNLYLRCAVHPSTVLTQNAIDCSDYSPLNKNLIEKKD